MHQNYHQLELNPHHHNQPKKTKTVAFNKGNFGVKAKAKTYPLPGSIPQISRMTKTKKAQLILSVTIISKNVILSISVSKISQKNSVNLSNFYNND